VFCPLNRHGRVFPERVSDHAVALVVKRYALQAGLDATALAGSGRHRLRLGSDCGDKRELESRFLMSRSFVHLPEHIFIHYSEF
jgi:hypothetical protein